MIWTIPNILTIGRIAAAPAILVLAAALPRAEAETIAAVLFVAAALTDFLDGWLARRLDRVSAFGRMLDPIADKVMVIATLAALLALQGPVWWLVLPTAAIILREVLISGVREFVGGLPGAVSLPVTRLAKWKTAAQMTALGALLLAGPVGAPMLWAGAVLLWLAAVLTLITGWDYLSRAIVYIGTQEER